MEMITLQPGVWTQFHGAKFQVRGQYSVRLAFGSGTGPANGDAYYPPELDTDVYLLTQDYNPQIVDVADFQGPYLWLMPHGDEPVVIIAVG